jgi:hypothetical protein
MQTQSKYRNELIKELQDVPEEDMPKLLEIVHYLKAGMKKSKRSMKIKKGKDPLFELSSIAVETGIEDLAENHDHYLYGVSK